MSSFSCVLKLEKHCHPVCGYNKIECKCFMKHKSLRPAPPMLSMALQLSFSHPRLVIYFSWPHPQNWTRTAKCERLLIVSNAPGQIKPSRQSTAAGLRLCCAFLPVSRICATMLGQNHIAEPTQHVPTFLHPKFVVYCTSGVALTNLSMTFSSTIGHCISIKF